jgi:hypothetical protein
MANDTQRYTANTIIVAARDLQDAAGSPEKPIEVPANIDYSLGEAVQLLSAEIRLLHERGFSDARIADLFTSFEIDATAADIDKYYERSEEAE